MHSIALFAPDDELYQCAINILSNINDERVIVKKVTTQNVVMNTQSAISDGINIIIARGRQASEIKKHTNATVVEIKMK